jgi:spore germination cell wall hydrolase CwlJ-like protein
MIAAIALAAARPAPPTAPETAALSARATKADEPAAVPHARKDGSLATILEKPDGLPSLAGPPSILASVSPEMLPRTVFSPTGPTPPAVPVAKPRKPDADEAGTVEVPRLFAYAADASAVEDPFRLILGSDADAASDLQHGVSGNGLDHWWSDRPLPEDAAADSSVECLAQAIYFESRGEPDLGQMAVAQVVINRVKNPAYPDDICGVVYQNRNLFRRCQFTFACDRLADTIREPEAWEKAMRIAKSYASGEAWVAAIGAATHYHAHHVAPGWAQRMKVVKVIEGHIFYMTQNGDWG